LNDFLNQDSEKLLKGCHPEIKKGNVVFRWTNLANSIMEDLLFDGQNPEDEDIKREVPMTLIECEEQRDPLLANLGLWEMAQDFPIKMAG